MERRLAAIMLADIVGYTALMAESEARGLRVRERHRALVRPLVETYHGEAIEARGDESLAVFPTALDAVNCALAIEAQLAGDAELRLHIGIHLGDLVIAGGEVTGDAVNIAARIRSFAEAGVCVSGEVYHAVRNQPNIVAKPLGEHEFRNVGRSVAVYVLTGAAAAPGAAMQRVRARPLALAAIGTALFAALGWWGLGHRALGGRPPAETGAPLTSIAVLPFDDMSPSGDQKWLADGMAEELIETLSRIEALRVLARTSAFAMKGKDIATVGSELRVGSVVEGSVRRSDDQLRVTAQLIRVSDGSHLWSARYDRKLADMFGIQTEVARAIAEAIRSELGIALDYSWLRSHGPSDVRAYELVKKALDARLPLFTEAGIRKAIEYDEQSLAIEPDYAQGHADLGFSYLELWRRYERTEANLARARAEAERALAIDASNGSANDLLARFLIATYQWEDARRLIDRGLAHNPGHGTLRFTSARLLALQGRTEEALIEIHRAVDLDPGLWAWHFYLGFFRMLAGEYDGAVDEMERAWDLAPSAGIREPLGYAYHLSGRDEEALEANVRDLPPELESMGAALRQGFAEAGFLGMVRANVAWRVANKGHACTNAAGFDNSGFLALLGEADALFECLDRAVHRGDELYLAFRAYDPYRSDPRFTALLRRMNLAE